MVTVIDTTVKNNLCCGCGACVAFCPSNAFEMKWNPYGELNPIRIHDCKKECGLCLSVCPFIDTNPNEDLIGKKLFEETKRIQHTSETGFYLSSGVGAVCDEQRRWKSASGGLATWFLEKLLTEKIVDAVLCVRKSDNEHHLYHFFVAKTPEDIQSSCGSAYYPTEMSEVIKYVLEHPGRYAAIGVPCFVKALRLASFKNKNLKERLIVIAGLTCGQMKNTNFTRYIAYLSGLSEEIQEVSFRCKSIDKPANNFYFNFIGVSGKITHFFWGGALSKVWGSKAFTVPACDFCDDIFAECADITFMDAWLSAYRPDSRGTSLVIVRTPVAENILKMGSNDEVIDYSSISIEKIIQSQGGVIENKRPRLAYRLYQTQSGIRKRVAPSKKLVFVERRKCDRALRVRERMRDSYVRHAGDSIRVQAELDKLIHVGFLETKLYFVWRAVRFAVRTVKSKIQLKG